MLSDIGFPKHDGGVGSRHGGRVLNIVGRWAMQCIGFETGGGPVMRAVQVPSLSIHVQRLSLLYLTLEKVSAFDNFPPALCPPFI